MATISALDRVSPHSAVAELKSIVLDQQKLIETLPASASLACVASFTSARLKLYEQNVRAANAAAAAIVQAKEDEPNLCWARKYNEGKGAQCSRGRIEGNDYCKQHLNGSHKEGDVRITGIGSVPLHPCMACDEEFHSDHPKYQDAVSWKVYLVGHKVKFDEAKKTARR
jgi:hypothetical protein